MTTAKVRETREVRAAVATFRAQARIERPGCWLCGQEIDYTITDPYDPGAFEVDHLYPVAKRPDLAADITTFRASHRGCNNARSDTSSPALLGRVSQDWEGMA